jgi:hypothetical protein
LRDQIKDAEQNGERPEATGGERILPIQINKSQL